MSIALGVNIDHVATLRQARRVRYPDPLHAALLAEQAGADSITLHLREDRRHIQDADVAALRAALQTRMNLEMAATAEMQAIALHVRPADVCLVPERRRGGHHRGRPRRGIPGRAAARLRCAARGGGRAVSCSSTPTRRRSRRRRPSACPSSSCIPAPTPRLPARRAPRNCTACASPRARPQREDSSSTRATGSRTTTCSPWPRSAIVELNIGHSIIARAVFTGARRVHRRDEAADAGGAPGPGPVRAMTRAGPRGSRWGARRRP